MAKAPRRSLKGPLSDDQQVVSGAGALNRTEMPPAETARYIAEITAELSFLARRSKLDLLAYLLDMSKLEAVRAMQAAVRKR